MKLKTRLGAAFLIITIVPMMLFYFLVVALSDYQTKSFSREYGLTEQVGAVFRNSMQIFNRITKRSQEEMRKMLERSPEKYEDPSYLDRINQELNRHYAYLIVRKDGDVIYCGDSKDPGRGSLALPMSSRPDSAIWTESWREESIWTGRASILSSRWISSFQTTGGKRLYHFQCR